MSWYSGSYADNLKYIPADYSREVPPYTYGAVQGIGQYDNVGKATMDAACPDGTRNAWEVTVPNGVYTVTTAHTAARPLLGDPGCTFENIRSDTGNQPFTSVYSVGVHDGRFTMSSAGGSCDAMNWIKLDLVSSKLYPTPWLPAPQKAWWQMELDDPTADVGLVQVRVPHERWWTTSNRHYPGKFHTAPGGVGYPDCRQSWLFMPAKCYRMFMAGQKKFHHPDLVSYPNFPGFSQPFLEWYFDIHDTDKNGELVYEEFRAAQSQQAINGTYAMWERIKTRSAGYRDTNAHHLWRRLDVMHEDFGNESVAYSPNDQKISKDEWVHGILSKSQNQYCDLFDRTSNTHGGIGHNGRDGGCVRKMDGPIPQHWGVFPDDGNHGFMVSVSDTPCTDKDGCPTGANVSLCEYRNHYTARSYEPALVNCKGAKGKYVQITLPGDDGKRLLPTLHVKPYRATIPIPKTKPPTSRAQAVNSTNPFMQMSCYGVKPRPLPDPNSADLLAAAKLHPKTIVTNNPEDPIFWSTCYSRVVYTE